MCWCTMAASPCMPVADGGGIMPDPAVGRPLGGMVPDLFNILPLVDCMKAPAESMGCEESDREVGGERMSSWSCLLSFAEEVRARA